MNAKEMFGALVYKEKKLWNDLGKQYGVEYILDYGNKWHEVRFMFGDKTVQISKIFYEDKKMWSFAFDVELYQAITQQMKELGWLE